MPTGKCFCTDMVDYIYIYYLNLRGLGSCCLISWTYLGLGLPVFNATFNNISVISWWSVLLVEETGENHRPVASHWQTLSHNVVLSTPHHECQHRWPTILFFFIISIPWGYYIIVSASTLTWFIRYIYYWKIQFLDNVISPHDKHRFSDPIFWLIKVVFILTSLHDL